MSEASTEKAPTSAELKFKCRFCEFRFEKKHQYRYHEQKKHPHERSIHPIPIGKSVKCLLCSSDFYRNTIYSHFESKHGISMQNEVLKFSNMSEFLSWKVEMERETNSRYKKERGNGADNLRHHYFMCYRSGAYITISQGIRKNRTKGSIKINGFCPSHIKVKQSYDGSYTVIFQKTHIGHELDFDHNYYTPKLHRCLLCGHEFDKNDISRHLQSEHEVILLNEVLNFSDIKDFYSWKEEMEKITNCKYCITPNQKKDGTRCFVCHRSGEPKGGFKSPRAKGSIKLCGYCPAFIQVKESENGSCSVHFQKTHVGHELGPDHSTSSYLKKTSTPSQKTDVYKITNLKEISDSKTQTATCTISRTQEEQDSNLFIDSPQGTTSETECVIQKVNQINLLQAPESADTKRNNLLSRYKNILDSLVTSHDFDYVERHLSSLELVINLNHFASS